MQWSRAVFTSVLSLSLSLCICCITAKREASAAVTAKMREETAKIAALAKTNELERRIQNAQQKNIEMRTEVCSGSACSHSVYASSLMVLARMHVGPARHLGRITAPDMIKRVLPMRHSRDAPVISHAQHTLQATGVENDLRKQLIEEQQQRQEDADTAAEKAASAKHAAEAALALVQSKTVGWSSHAQWILYTHRKCIYIYIYICIYVYVSFAGSL